MKILSILLVIGCTLFAQDLSKQFEVQIKECSIQNKVFSFDTLNCEEPTHTLNKEWKEFYKK